MPRFVVLRHESPRGLHWDFMLETGEALTVWALAAPPETPGAVAAEALPDHRLAYLDYEGPVSAGRGEVTRWDRGTYAFQRRSAGEAALVLQGTRLRGRALLVRSTDDPAAWTFTWWPDKAASG